MTSQNLGLTVAPNDTIHWVPCTSGEVPHGAVIGGRSFDNEVLYIGRTKLIENRNEYVPGFIMPSQKCLVSSYGTGVRKAVNFEVLVTNNIDTIHWVSCHGNAVPNNSVIGGIDCSYLEPLYIGRTTGSLQLGRTWRGQRVKIPEFEELDSEAHMSQFHIPGKVHRSHKCLYIPYMGKEYLFRKFEVLVLTESPASLAAICRHSIRNNLSKKCKDENSTENLDSAQCENAIESYIMDSIDLLPLPEKMKEYCRESISEI